MKERPILMSGPMVRAVLENRKTQTRPVVKRLPCQCGEFEPEEMPGMTLEGWQSWEHSGRWWCQCCASAEDAVMCPYGKPGDRLWVRETWGTTEPWDAIPPSQLPIDLTGREPHARIFYAADWSGGGRPEGLAKWRPSIHMPRAACRQVLEVTSVKVERLNAISRADTEAEGVGCDWQPDSNQFATFTRLWDSLAKAPHRWADNPWVWVVEFKRVES